MGNAYTIYVQLTSDKPIVRYESAMGKLNTVEVEHATGLQRFGQMTPSEYTNLHLVAANLPDLPNAYHRVRWSTLQKRYICSCGDNCDHWHPITQSA